MFEVLVFVYENYFAGAECPEPAHLQRKLSAVGFETQEIADALTWLGGLNTAAQRALPVPDVSPRAHEPLLRQAHSTSVRVYAAYEQLHLGTDCLGFISFLESAGALPPHMREVVLDRAMAAPGGPVSLDDLKIIVLMVYWSFGQEPDPLVLDELCDNPTQRLAH